jgi:tetratricopeptide (TPR) repeat protein
VRVTAYLIDPKKDKILWQNGFDQPYKRIITIPADIVLQVADRLKTNLTGLEKQNIERVPTTSQEAYKLMQQAHNLLNTSTYKSYDQLYDLSLRAIDLDPGYADAYALAGVMLAGKGNTWGEVAMQTIIWDAIKLWDKALELDQNNAIAHLGLALFNEFMKWDYIRAEEEFLKAIELSPNSQAFSRVYSEFLQKRNRLEDARAYRIKGEADPIRIDILSRVLSGKKDEAHKYLKPYLQSKNTFAGEYFIWLEDYEAAKSIFEAALQNKNQYVLRPRYQACLALAYYKTNDRHKAQAIIDKLIEKSDTSLAGSPEFYTGWYYSGIGELDSAFYWLEKAYTNHCPEIPWLKVDPVLKNLRSDDRYWDLYERTGHKVYDDYFAGKNK